jgi:c-di-GMP-related signal transduction protein
MHDSSTVPNLPSQAADDRVYLGRQPIVDRNGALQAFELLFRSDAINRASIIDDVEATAHVLARTFVDVGIVSALGPHPGYVNVSRDLLNDDVVSLIPSDRFVLEVLEGVTFDTALFERCAQLRREGFRFALDDVTRWSEAIEAILPHIDIVKIDLLYCAPDHLDELVNKLKPYNKVLLAEKVETRAAHDRAMELGFDLFQGYYFARPQILVSRRTDAPRHALLRLLQLLSKEAALGDLESELKANPALVMQLLRLVNATAFGLRRPIGSLREAIMVLGTKQISRWAQLLLYADGRNLPLASNPLVVLAGTRARFMELSAGLLWPGDEPRLDAAFMTGVFSLIDVVFGEPMPELLDKLQLAPPIEQAIRSRSGELGHLLAAAEAAEQGDDKAIERACANLPELTPYLISHIGLAAATWFAERMAD